MVLIAPRNIIAAVLRVERMGFEERVQRADEVHTGQPNLFFSVLGLHRYEATLVQIEVVLNLLLVCHEAMTISARACARRRQARGTPFETLIYRTRHEVRRRSSRVAKRFHCKPRFNAAQWPAIEQPKAVEDQPVGGIS